MKKIIEETASWDLVRQLPAEYAGFTLDTRSVEERGSQYSIFTYSKPEDYRSFSVLYDKATKDYLARVTVGLTEYYDVSFITADLAGLEKAIEARLKRTLEQLGTPAVREYESIFRSKNILQWPYASKLPQEVAGFRLFIQPQESVKIINGSYIIIDYSDFEAQSNLTVYYNVYRDEFFGEVRLRLTPRMLNVFDSKELTDLADKLEANLGTALTNLRGELG